MTRPGIRRSGSRSLLFRARRTAVGVLIAVPAMLVAPLAVLPAAPAVAATTASPPTGSTLPPNNDGMATSPVSSVAGSMSQPPSAADVAVTDAKAQAKSTGQRVHVGAQDDETSTTFANPDGTMTTDIASGPVRVKRNGAWVTVDPTLVAANGTVAPKAAKPLVTFSGGGSAAPLASFTDETGHNVSFRWPGNLPTPVLSGNKATYPNVVPGSDLVLTTDRLGIEVSLLVRTRPTTPVVLKIPMQLGGGLSVKQAPNGDLQLVDGTGALIAYSPAPTMYGAAIDPHSGLPTQSGTITSQVVNTANGPELDLTPDMSFLTNPATAYPVTIDPSTSLSLDVDTFVQSGFPTSTEGASQADLRVGTYNGGGNYDQSYVQFHAGPIKNKTVTSATMHFWNHYSWSCTASPFQVYQAGGVSGSTTWNSRPATYQQWYNGSFAHGYDTSCGGQDVAIPGTAAAQFWAGDANSETETVSLKAPSTTDNNQWKKFNSSRGYVPPSVSVTYNDTTPGANDGLKTEFTDTVYPKMSGTVHNADGSAMTAYFTVKTASGTVISGAGGSQANVANGARAAFQIPGDQLIANHDYTWSMHTCANGNCSAETAAQPFRINPLRGVGDVRGHKTYSKSSGQGSSVKIDEASGNAQVGITGFTFVGNAGYNLPIGVRYDSMAVAGNASPASGTGGTGLGSRFSSGPGISLTIRPDKTVDFIGPSGEVHEFCCEPGSAYYRNGNYDVDFNKQTDGTYKLVEHASQLTYLFTGSGRLTDQKDRNKNNFHFTYDAAGGLSKIDAQDETGAVVRSVTVATDGSHRITGVTQTGDANTPDRSVNFRYNGAGYLDQVTDPAGQNTDLAYDGTGNLTTLTTPGNRQIALAYDGAHRVTSLTQKDPAGTDSTSNLTYSNPSVTKQQTKLYDPNHTVASGIATTYDADNTGKITKATDPFGQHTDVGYTPSGSAGGDQVQSSSSPDAGMTTNTYDQAVNGGESLTQSSAPSGTVKYAYGNTGSANKYLPSSSSDPNNVATGYKYDAPGNQLESNSGGSSPAATAKVDRNNDGTVSTSTDPKNSDAGLKTTYAYDGFGQLLTVTPPTGNTLGVRRFTYDVLGRQTTSASGSNITTTYAYDKLDRPTGKSTAGTPNCPSPLSSTTVCYSYDPDGNVTGRTDAAGTMAAAFDGKGQQTSKDQAGPPTTYRFDYAYDAAGNLTQNKETLGVTVHTVSYGYNNAELLEKATEGDGTVDLFGYNKDHKRTDTWYAVSGTNSTPTYDATNKWQILAPAGFSGHIDLTLAKDKLTGEKTTRASNDATVASDLTYAYNLASGPCGAVAESKNKNSVKDNQTGNTTYYCRNSMGKLTREDTLNSGGGTISDYSYAYDASGNRTSGPEGSHTYNSANQLTSDGATYDADGNRTQPGAIGYNATDQSTNFNGTATTYADSDQKERTSYGSLSFASGATGTASLSVSGAGTTFYDRDPSGTLLGTHGPDGDHNYYFDGHGSTIGLLDHAGTVQATFGYDAYGGHYRNTGPNTNAALHESWLYSGGFFDGHDGLYKFGQRYYQPNLGSWTQQDSIEALANLTDGNRYAYAADNPVDNSDPTGKYCANVSIAIVSFGECNGSGYFDYSKGKGAFVGINNADDPPTTASVGCQGGLLATFGYGIDANGEGSGNAGVGIGATCAFDIPLVPLI